MIYKTCKKETVEFNDKKYTFEPDLYYTYNEDSDSWIPFETLKEAFEALEGHPHHEEK